VRELFNGMIEPSTGARTSYARSANSDGRSGANRALTPELCQISADDDLAAIAVWLAEFAHSPHTFRSYRKEAIRLLCWATRVRHKAVSSLTREDVLAYEAFLATPMPAAVLGTDLARVLSSDSQRQAMGIVGGLFTYLVNAGYLAGNPWTLRRRKRIPRVRQVERYLDQSQWATVLDFLETLPQQSRRERQYYERARWVVRFLYDTALRVSEASPQRHRFTTHSEEPAARLDRDDGHLPACRG